MLYETKELLLQGLDQKTDAKSTIPGKLITADNIEFDKQGILNRRRGFKLPSLSEVLGLSTEIQFSRLGVFQDEMVFIGYNYLYSMADPDAGLGSGVDVVRRGTVPRGVMERYEVTRSTESGRAPDDRAVYPNPYIQQGDVAALDHGGVRHECYVWSDLAANEIRCEICIIAPHGNRVRLLRTTVDTPSATADCPKVIASGTNFICLFIDITAGGARSLQRKYIDVSTIDSTSTWTDIGSLTLDSNELYDVAPINANDYVVVRRVASNSMPLARYDGTAAAATWSTGLTTEMINCCAVYADDTSEDIVILAFERGPEGGGAKHEMWAYRTLASDGTGGAFSQAFTSLGDTNYSQVGVARLSSTSCAIVTECHVHDDDEFARWDHRCIAAVSVLNSTAAMNTDEQKFHNLTMLSRPFALATDQSSSSDLYCFVGFHSYFPYQGDDDPAANLEQSLGFVVNLEHGDWNGGEFTVQAKPCANMNLGGIDSRPGNLPHENGPLLDSNQRCLRNNHISSVVSGPGYGPKFKTRVAAIPTYSRIGVAGTNTDEYIPEQTLIPLGFGISSYAFHFEEPWLYPRNGETALSQNVNTSYPYVQHDMHDLGDTLYMGGGCPSLYDGAQVVEQGYSWCPEINHIQPVQNEDGQPGGHLYFYTATYEWRDSTGKLHRSRPCSPVGYTTIANDGAKIFVRNQNLTLKDNYQYGTSTPIEIVIWRTLESGSIFYRLQGSWDAEPTHLIEDTIQNDPLAPYSEFSDAMGAGVLLDNDLENHEVLPYQFTNSIWQPLVPFQAPSASVTADWKNRLFIAPTEAPQDIWYSLEFLPEGGGTFNQAPEFSPLLIYRLDESSPVTGMHAMDNALVVFKKDRIYRIVGNTADGNGNNQSLSHSIIATGTGCISPRSIVHGPDGLYFQSEKGYYLLRRNFTLDYLQGGASVEDAIRSAGVIVSASLLEDRHQIRLICNETAPDESSAGQFSVLVYDYLWGMWSRASMPQGNSTLARARLIDGCAWRGYDGSMQHAVLFDAGLFLEQDPGGSTPYRDEDYSGNDAVLVDIYTGWISLGGKGGFYRLRSITVTGDKGSASGVNVDVDLDLDGDFEADVTDNYSWDSLQDSPMVVFPSEQKVNAFRVRIYDPSGVEQDASLKIGYITLEVGTRRGPVPAPENLRAT